MGSNKVSIQHSRVDDAERNKQPQKPACRIIAGAARDKQRRRRLEQFAVGREAGFEVNEASRKVDVAEVVRWEGGHGIGRLQASSYLCNGFFQLAISADG